MTGATASTDPTMTDHRALRFPPFGWRLAGPGLLALALAPWLATAAHAGGEHEHTPAATPRASAVSDMTEGEVRRVDKAQGKLTLKHGPIANLSMPGMTMVFRVADPAMLDRVQDGDKVRFSAERLNGFITVTRLDALR